MTKAQRSMKDFTIQPWLGWGRRIFIRTSSVLWVVDSAYGSDAPTQQNPMPDFRWIYRWMALYIEWGDRLPILRLMHKPEADQLVRTMMVTGQYDDILWDTLFTEIQDKILSYIFEDEDDYLISVDSTQIVISKEGKSVEEINYLELVEEIKKWIPDSKEPVSKEK